MEDLKSRLAGRVQLTTDGHQAYVAPVGLNFPQDGRLGADPEDVPQQPEWRTALQPPVCTGIKTRILKGDPEPDRISTSDRT